MLNTRCFCGHREGADHQSLAQLLQDLTKKLQGEQIEALNLGTTIRRPLHVSIQVCLIDFCATPSDSTIWFKFVLLVKVRAFSTEHGLWPSVTQAYAQAMRLRCSQYPLAHVPVECLLVCPLTQ